MALLALAADLAAAYPFQSGFNSSSTLGLIRPRNIGPFVADITISERHRDEMIITEHPIEVGSVVSDHAFKRPIHVILTVGYSSSDVQAQGDANYIQTVYQNFLTLQQNATPFSVTTGKRTLQNMLVEYINELTNEQTENALILEIGCKQVILVNSTSASVAPAGTSTPSNQAQPLVNSDPTMVGNVPAQVGNNFNAAGLTSAGVAPGAVSAP